MDQFERDILSYMLQWSPHGALEDEDLFPKFGMNVKQFERRFVRLLAKLKTDRLDHADRELLEGARRCLRYQQPPSEAANDAGDATNEQVSDMRLTQDARYPDPIGNVRSHAN